jgi:hypothetical protein
VETDGGAETVATATPPRAGEEADDGDDDGSEPDDVGAPDDDEDDVGEPLEPDDEDSSID